MDNCLLIGNGLNRCLEHSISWDNLLKELSDVLGVDYYDNIAMPMEYERIVNAHLKANPEKTYLIYTETKKTIAKRLSNVNLPENAIHNQIARVDINAILTTNYDFLLEYVYNPQYEDKGASTKYLPHLTSTQKGVQFYHPHGIASRYNSLCLGYEHYMGIVEKIRREINTKENNNVDMMRIKQVLHGEKEQENTWYERFYTSNIAMIGFGLTDCESDFWWLLTHRAFLYYCNYCDFKTVLKNSIIYYDVINDIPNDNVNKEVMRKRVALEKNTRHILLSNEHVFVKKYLLSKFDGSYASAYIAIIEDIKRNSISNQTVVL